MTYSREEVEAAIERLRNCFKDGSAFSRGDAHKVVVHIEALETALAPGGVQRIAAERRRQIQAEGFTLERDQELYGDGSLVSAAIAYATEGYQPNHGYKYWPWFDEWWKPSDDPIRNLEKAGALIAAEIDRLEAARALLPEARDE